MTRNRHILWKGLGLLVLALAGTFFLDYRNDQAGPGAPMEEQVTRDEDFYTARIIALAIDSSTQARAKLINESRDPATAPSSAATNPGFSPDNYTRDAHAKGHGCVLATFTVNKDVDPRYAFGIFKVDPPERPQQYNALIRFSSGNPDVQSDSEKDVRGMAIKLLKVHGTKLMATEETDNTQDFVLMNNPVFFIRTIEEYAEFNRQLVAGHPFWYFLPGLDILGKNIPYAKIWRWHVRELAIGKSAQKAPPASLVTTRFWSGSAYTLGPKQYVKYSAIPCIENKPALNIANSKSPDYLRLELAKQSEKGGACFDFAVQPQVFGKNMPVEDTTVEWKESDSPFVPLARMVIKPGQNNTEQMNEQCENTAFNPWHSLADHKPVGVMNRVRQPLYLAMSRFRQAKNCSANCDSKCNHFGYQDNACQFINEVAKEPAAAPAPN